VLRFPPLFFIEEGFIVKLTLLFLLFLNVLLANVLDSELVLVFKFGRVFLEFTDLVFVLEFLEFTNLVLELALELELEFLEFTELALELELEFLEFTELVLELALELELEFTELVLELALELVLEFLEFTELVLELALELELEFLEFTELVLELAFELVFPDAGFNVACSLPIVFFRDFTLFSIG
jgi:hypothetical protein